MRTFSRGFAAPGAVIFLAIIGLVAWYRNHEVPQASTTATSTLSAQVRISGEGRTTTVR